MHTNSWFDQRFFISLAKEDNFSSFAGIAIFLPYGTRYQFLALLMKAQIALKKFFLPLRKVQASKVLPS